MWFLEHEILFGGKRVWLRPGSQQLFGRTKNSDGNGSTGKNIFIDNKNVSRKHMMIKVAEVPLGDGTKVHKRSQIEITDLSCRQGTVVDGETSLKSSKQPDGTITEDKITLTGTEHTIKVSHSYPPFTVRWQDVVFTYAFKEKKGASQSQASTRNAELHALDIKTSSEFLYGKTTHVVSQKRNLPKVLQALVSGTPVVTADYLDAILSAAANSSGSDGNYVPSQLEEDFDTWWPQEKEYIPPAGQEPVPRPDQMLAPDTTRSEVFSGLTFVFLDEAQHTTLHQVVAGGGGKALLFHIQPGVTTVGDYVDYVKKVAGLKKRGSVGKNGLPVVTIRLPNYPEESEEWATNFVTGVDQSLKQRSILQNEFLDAIITKDTSSLRRPPTETETSYNTSEPAAAEQPNVRDVTQSSPSRAQVQVVETDPSPTAEPPKTNPRKRPARRAVTSRFTGFDDYVPPAKMQKIEHTSVQDTLMEDVQPDVPQSVPDYEPATQSHIPPTTQTQRANRSEPQSTLDSAHTDQMFPASAKFRKSREATQARATSQTVQIEPQIQGPRETKEQKLARLQARQLEQAQKMKNEMDKMEKESRNRMVAEEDRRRAEEEKMRADLEGVDISKLHIDIEIGSMKIRPQGDRNSARTPLRDEVSNPEWAGRKNFKKFQRKGINQGASARSQKVIVRLKPAPPRKGFGDSMTTDDVALGRTAEDEKRLKKWLGGRLPDSEDERPMGFQRRRRAKPTEVINVEDSGPEEEESPRPSGSTIRNSGRTQRVVETQLDDTQTPRQAKKRTGAPLTVAAGQPSTKKSRTANEDSDEEEGGFRFKKRAKG